MPDKKLRILAFVDYYLPGFRGGGPAHSVSRLVQKLSAEIEFMVFTRDRDLGESEPFPEVLTGAWFEDDGVRFYYAKPPQLSVRGILKVIREVNPDVLYLNSYFSKLTRTVFLLQKLGFLEGKAILVAPRGEFSKGALSIKTLRKRVYLAAAALIRMHRRVTWQVSSVHELADTVAVISGEPECFIKAPDMLLPERVPTVSTRLDKEPGLADFAFVSRIAPIKNLKFAIENLKFVHGQARFTIYGPDEDKAYWQKCVAAINDLPPYVRCEYVGPVPSSEVVTKLARHQFFLFPTNGENFGHVISEALLAGCPVLLSDRTPWLDLDANDAGWVMPLEDPSRWQSVIQECIDMGPERYAEMSKASRAYVEHLIESNSDLDSNRQMFHTAMRNNIRTAA